MAGNSKLLGGRRAPLAISACGAITAAGRGARAIESALAGGRTAIAPLEGLTARSFQNRVGARVDALLLGDADRGDPAAPGRVARCARRALGELVADAEARGGLPRGVIGAAFGTALGDAEALERFAARSEPSIDVDEFSFERLLRNILDARGELASLDLSGPRRVFSATCVSALCALEQAAADLAFGRAAAMLVGAFDSLSRSMQAGFSALRALSPSGRLRAFEPEHDGIVLGEGAAFALVEPLAAARLRNARVGAAIVAARLESDSRHLTSPDSDGVRMSSAVRQVLDDAGLTARDLGCVLVTASGSAVYDRMLSRALHAALGEDACARLAVTTWEPAVGHLLAATGAMAIVHAAAIVESRRIPALVGVDRVDPECRLDYVLDQPRALEHPAVLALVVGFGGQNGVVLVTSPELASDLSRAAGSSGEAVGESAVAAACDPRGEAR